jgi:hypothetical protein
MRCACPLCGAFMPQADRGGPFCICPNCLYRCAACMGTPGLISREKLREALGDPVWQSAFDFEGQEKETQRKED